MNGLMTISMTVSHKRSKQEIGRVRSTYAFEPLIRIEIAARVRWIGGTKGKPYIEF